jgi:nucleotide-binding universal stress UspA family protein
MKTIVLGYDGTEESQRALERAAAIALAFGSSVIVTSVSTRLGGAVHGGGSGDPVDPPEAHEALLDGATKRLADRGVHAESVLAMGDAAEAIVELAHQRNADLIVVGTREPGFFERLLGHSVSGSVQRQAHCDVLIVR